jgi:DNA-binding response OmpR family regulator
VSYYNTQLVNWLPILVIYADSPPAEELANELKLSGLTTDIAINCTAAITGLRVCYYGSMVFIGELSHPADLRYVAQLRQERPRSWIIMISSTAPSDMRELFTRYGIDAVLVTPFSTNNLVSRLLAFSRRSRPI